MRMVDAAEYMQPCSALASDAPASHCSSAGSNASPHSAFLQQWGALIAPRLIQLLQRLQQEQVAQALAVAQVWTYLPVLTEGRQLLRAEQLCLLGDASLQAFHEACARDGVTVSQLGPMGKVWESGAVQVVQCADSLSDDAHPRNRLPGELTGRIAECIYLPVYDRTGQVSQGVLAVVELLVRSQSHDDMVVANAISCLCGLLESLNLSLYNPHLAQQAQQAAQQQAAQQAALQQAQQAAQQAALQYAQQQAVLPGQQGAGPGKASDAMLAPHATAYQHSPMARVSGSGGSAGSGGSLGRTVSMRTFC